MTPVVTMYTTAMASHCIQAERFLKAKGVRISPKSASISDRRAGR
jgi:hypothetical protein